MDAKDIAGRLRNRAAQPSNVSNFSIIGTHYLLERKPGTFIESSHVCSNPDLSGIYIVEGGAGFGEAELLRNPRAVLIVNHPISESEARVLAAGVAAQLKAEEQ